MVCINCGENLSKRNSKFCSSRCDGEYKSRLKYEEYLRNPEKFCREGYTPRFLKQFILVEQECKCAICSISNIWNNKSLVFILDHIDGNSSNNLRDNLRLICPNCDSQLDTYKSKNRGNGRFYRKKRRELGLSY